jgi:hypothetical protein
MNFGENWYDDSQIQNLVRLTEIVRDIPGSIIEIGCWKGKSASYLANAVYPEILMCNDTWKGNIEESDATGEEHISVTIAKREDVYGTFLSNMNSLTKGNFSVVKMNCFVWIPTIPDKSVKFAHIDASHDYHSVKKTLEMMVPKMIEGGIMCGDDFLSAHKGREDLHGGVERAVTEIFGEGVMNFDNLWCVRIPL